MAPGMLMLLPMIRAFQPMREVDVSEGSNADCKNLNLL